MTTLRSLAIQAAAAAVRERPAAELAELARQLEDSELAEVVRALPDERIAALVNAMPAEPRKTAPAERATKSEAFEPSGHAAKVLALLRRKKVVAMGDVVKHLGTNTYQARAAVAELERQGLALAEGEGRARVYRSAA